MGGSSVLGGYVWPRHRHTGLRRYHLAQALGSGFSITVAVVATLVPDQGISTLVSWGRSLAVKRRQHDYLMPRL